MPQKRQGDRFAQVQLFADSRLAPPPAETRELERALPGAPALNLLPPEVRFLLRWSEADAKTPGAYPLR